MSTALRETNLIEVLHTEGISAYKISSKKITNEYFILSSPASRHLMASPEVVGYDSYLATVDATRVALRHICSNDFDNGVSILTILRGGLNYPLEECCHQSGIQVNNINFVSCERVIENGVITGLDIKYEKLHIEKDCILMIGDIIASGDTLSHCMRKVASAINQRGGSVRKIIFFTIGGTKAITLLEELTVWLRTLWPQFQGFQCFFYEGVFSVYQDKGVTGVNFPDIDFGWKDGIISPDFRSYIMDDDNALFEKCIIYDGGARRYEIPAHIEEVIDYWESLLNVADSSDLKAFIEEKAGYGYPVSYKEWLKITHLPESDRNEALYNKEMDFIERSLTRSLEEICQERLKEFSDNMQRFNK